MNKLGLIFFAATLFLAGCADPAANKPKATVDNTNKPASPASTAPAEKPAPKGEALALNGENSKIGFTGSKVTGKHDGGFKNLTGTIDLVNSKAEESSVTVEIDTTSIFSDADKLTEHLKSSDFFDTAKYPTASFKSTKIVADSAKGAGNYTVSGEFTIHGTTKSVSFPAKITVGDAEVAVESEFSINRKDFGIVYAGKTDDLIRDDVVLRLSLKSARKK